MLQVAKTVAECSWLGYRRGLAPGCVPWAQTARDLQSLTGGFLGWHHEVLCGGLCAAGGPISQPPEEVTGVGSVRGLPGINYHLHRACWAQLP